MRANAAISVLMKPNFVLFAKMPIKAFLFYSTSEIQNSVLHLTNKTFHECKDAVTDSDVIICVVDAVEAEMLLKPKSL